jgi:hypothetical protein
MFSIKNQWGKASILLIVIVLVALVALVPTGAVSAVNPPGTGQPGQDCESIGVTPGNAVNAPGSPFNPDGQAGTVYAGEQPQNSKNPNSVSQYDVACFQVSQP